MNTARLKYNFDWAGLLIIGHWLFGRGENINIKDDPRWTEYMTADNIETRATGEKAPYIYTIRNKVKELAFRTLPNTTQFVNEYILPLNLGDGFTKGYGLLHGIIEPGFHLSGSITRRTEDSMERLSCDSNSKTNKTDKADIRLRYTWIDNIDPNFKSAEPSHEIKYVVLANAVAILERAQLPKNYEISISWKADSQVIRNGLSISYKGWPFEGMAI